MLSVFTLSVVRLSVVRLNVVMLSVVAPSLGQSSHSFTNLKKFVSNFVNTTYETFFPLKGPLERVNFMAAFSRVNSNAGNTN